MVGVGDGEADPFSSHMGPDHLELMDGWMDGWMGGWNKHTNDDTGATHSRGSPRLDNAPCAVGEA